MPNETAFGMGCTSYAGRPETLREDAAAPASGYRDGQGRDGDGLACRGVLSAIREDKQEIDRISQRPHKANSSSPVLQGRREI